MIQLQDLRIDLGGKTVLQPLSLDLPRGQVTAVIGPNGAGKSSLMRAIAGILPATSGAVTLDGVPLPQLSPRDRAQRIGYLPQNAGPVWAITVREMVALGRLPHQSSMAGPSATDVRAIDQALADADLLMLADRRVDTLSGGELARAAFARVLASQSDWILADEPLANLDPAHQRDVLRLLRSAADMGKGVVVVLHELTAAAALADNIALLKHGALVKAGAKANVLTPPLLSAAFEIAMDVVESNGRVAILPHDPL